MDKYMKEIPSDSAITSIEINTNSISLYLNYGIEVGGKISGRLIFKKANLFYMSPRWQSPIDGVIIKNASKFLDEVKNSLKEDEEPEDNIQQQQSFQFLASIEKSPIVEIVAQGYFLVN